jgi:hypothetical protein
MPGSTCTGWPADSRSGRISRWLSKDIGRLELAFPLVPSNGNRNPVFIRREDHGTDGSGRQDPGALVNDLV